MQYGFIGCGNMGGAVARALCHTTDAKEVLLANRTMSKAKDLAQELGCAYGTNEDVAKSQKPFSISSFTYPTKSPLKYGTYVYI